MLVRMASKVGCGYAWAGHGQILTMNQINQWVKQYGRDKYYFAGYSVEKWLGVEVYDCSGFVIEMANLGIDANAHTIYHQYSIPITADNLTNGDILCRSNFGHIGFYYQGGVIHAKNTKVGVVFEPDINKLDVPFTHAGRLKKFTHWALNELIYLENLGLTFTNKDLNRRITMGELVSVIARYHRLDK